MRPHTPAGGGETCSALRTWIPGGKSRYIELAGDRSTMSPPMTTQAREARLSIGFINWAHALDHYVMLIFPTVVIGLELIYARSYAELIALGTASFVAFGIFSLPAGWLADRWSRRNMMVLFYAGCGVSLLAAALAPNLIALACALFAVGL